MQVIPLTLNKSNIIPLSVRTGKVIPMTPSYTGKTEIHWGKKAPNPNSPAQSKTPSYNHKDGPYGNRPPFDDGRCGGYTGGGPYDYEYQKWQYDKWIQDLER